ncbi:hypothetical protein BGW38_009302 [Lunasporangiospora selenospora]|uniref:Peroxisomal targeting signal receptor n=1 Tax=Lunasporangiospora selenospora TaxID=979761 RepID=A0A9P6KG04_9FUNG|nr:hypothetical protein BGW38_009302 [Lunasporangiospora selenospora]
MSFPGLVGGGADCGPSNAMSSLVKGLSRDRTLQQDRFAGSPHAGSSSTGFRTARPGPQQAGDQFSQEFLQAQQGSESHLFDFNDMGRELEGVHLQRSGPASGQPITAAPDWALDFMQQGHDQTAMHPPHLNHTQMHDFENAFMNAQQQRPAEGWQSDFATFEQTHRPALDHGLAPEQIEAFEKAFEDAKNVSEWESEFRMEHPQSWADEFAKQEGVSANSQADQDNKDALAKTAGMLLESVDTTGDERFKNSSFMNFMRRLRDQEVAIEGNKLVEQTTPATQTNAPEDWAASFHNNQGLSKGKERASDWSSEFEQQSQQNNGSTWATDFEKRIEQHIQRREAGNMWSTEFAAQQESGWAEEFSGAAVNANPVLGDQDWAQQFNASRNDVAQDWVNEFNSTNAADELEQAFQHQQDRQDQQASWVDSFRKNIAHLAQDPSDKEWDSLQKDWERNETTGLGYKASDPRYQSYAFEQNNPYMVADRPKLLDLASRGNLTEAILALEAAVQKDPMDAAAWHQLGLRQQENERETMAIAALSKAVEADPKELNAWLALAVSYTNENCRVDAYDALQSWVENSEQYQKVMKTIPAVHGRSATERHEYVTGLFLEAARSNPGENLDPDVQIALGVLFNVSEEYEKAVDCFRAALNLKPDDYMLWNKYGATLANSHNTSAAIEAYFNALNINPSYIRARYNLSIACINLGQHREAAEHLLSALSLQNAGDAARGVMVGSSAIGRQPDGGVGGMSQNIWETLKMAMYMLGRTDLAHRCETTRDLDAFREEFDF